MNVCIIAYYYANNSLSRQMIGNNIRKIRRQRKLTQEKLARLADISLNTLTKIESGFAKTPNIKTVVKIAKALNVSLDKLVENYL